jgi:hypothetical protein
MLGTKFKFRIRKKELENKWNREKKRKQENLKEKTKKEKEVNLGHHLLFGRPT